MWFLWLVIMVIGGFIGGWAGLFLTPTDPEDANSLTLVSLTVVGVLVGGLFAPRITAALTLVYYKAVSFISNLPKGRVAAVTSGVVIGLIVSVLLNNILVRLPFYSWWISVVAALVLCLFFSIFAIQNEDSLSSFVETKEKPEPEKEGGKLIDSNILIDGRIEKVLESGILEGKLIIPHFILYELQTLSDSADEKKRVRGKRGLEVAARLKENHQLVSHDWDEATLSGADQKLMRLASIMGATIITNDNNLRKLANVADIKTISLNEVAAALKMPYAEGDALSLSIIKTGNPPTQGIGYLEDGTMVVVTDAAKLRGKTVRVIIVSNTQTAAGRMYFARLERDEEGNLQDATESIEEEQSAPQGNHKRRRNRQ